MPIKKDWDAEHENPFWREQEARTEDWGWFERFVEKIASVYKTKAAEPHWWKGVSLARISHRGHNGRVV